MCWEIKGNISDTLSAGPVTWPGENVWVRTGAPAPASPVGPLPDGAGPGWRPVVRRRRCGAAPGDGSEEQYGQEEDVSGGGDTSAQYFGV